MERIVGDLFGFWSGHQRTLCNEPKTHTHTHTHNIHMEKKEMVCIMLLLFVCENKKGSNGVVWIFKTDVRSFTTPKRIVWNGRVSRRNHNPS